MTSHKFDPITPIMPKCLRFAYTLCLTSQYYRPPSVCEVIDDSFLTVYTLGYY